MDEGREVPGGSGESADRQAWDVGRVGSAVPEAAGSSDWDLSKGCGVLGEGGRTGVRVPWPVLGFALLSSPPPLHQALTWQPELRQPVGCPWLHGAGSPRVPGAPGGSFSRRGSVGHRTNSVNSHPPPGHLPLACLCLVFAKGTDILRVWKCLWGNHVPCQKPPTPTPPCPAPSPRVCPRTCPALSNSTSTGKMCSISWVCWGGGGDGDWAPAQRLSN